MKVYMLHSLQSEQSISGFPEIPESRSIEVGMARNSYVSFHIVLFSEESYEITQVETAGQAGISSSFHYAEDVVFDDGRYPDILPHEKSCLVEENTYQSVWVTFYAGKNAEAGVFPQDVKIHTSLGEVETVCRLRVFDIAIPDPERASFQMEYWIHAVNSWFRWPQSDTFDCIRHYFGCEKYSQMWWAINGDMAANMKEARINVLFVRTMDLLLDGGTSVDEKGNVDFSWELFDRWVDFYLERGSFQKLAGMHLVMQAEGRQVFVIKRGERGEAQLGLAPEESEEAVRWLEQYLSALYEHITQKGYRPMWLQHVQDEPMDPLSWSKIIPYVRKHMPGIRTLDAIDNQSPAPFLQNSLDLWIPRVDIYEKNREFYDFRLAEGDRRWVYTCCLPQERNYVNKFIDWPLIHGRVIGWGCFACHFSGFLHWGYDYWDPKGELFGLNPEAKVKGDGFIIYPDPRNGTIKNSVRMLATRDSAQDYELLHMLAEKDPRRAYELAAKVIRRFDDFNQDPQYFEKVRLELLRRLEECYNENEDCQPADKDFS